MESSLCMMKQFKTWFDAELTLGGAVSYSLVAD